MTSGTFESTENFRMESMDEGTMPEEEVRTTLVSEDLRSRSSNEGAASRRQPCIQDGRIGLVAVNSL